MGARRRWSAGERCGCGGGGCGGMVVGCGGLEDALGCDVMVECDGLIEMETSGLWRVCPGER